MGYIDKPQPLWWRKVLFQVHLWVGVILGIYIIVIGITGSILVFKDELAALSYPKLMRSQYPRNGRSADLPTVMERARQAFPKYKLRGAYMPGVGIENILTYMEDENEHSLYVLADPADGRIIGSLDLNRTWIFWISELHIRLLAGEAGFIANGIGAGFLLLLCCTGMVLWWPGIKGWTRALKVNLNRNWRRINFDLHSAAGFYTLVVISMWAMSGIYFVFPQQVEALVNRFSSVSNASPPDVQAPPPSAGVTADLRQVIAQARAALPANKLAGVFLPENDKQPITVYMAQRDPDDFTRMDYMYFDPSSGKQLAIWLSGKRPTLGSKFIFWLAPLHFGIYWGREIKILWAALGLSLPLLTVTGALMYWNRSLSRYWKRLRRDRAQSRLCSPS